MAICLQYKDSSVPSSVISHQRLAWVRIIMSDTNRSAPVPRSLRWRNEDVDMEDWSWPEDYDVNAVCHRITFGPGWVLLKKMFSDKDVEMARERILISKIPKGRRFSNTDDRHNNFNGLTWGLLSRGRIFAKVPSQNTHFLLNNTLSLR